MSFNRPYFVGSQTSGVDGGSEGGRLSTTRLPATLVLYSVPLLQAIKRVSDPQISPSGKWVMFSVTDVSLEKNTKTNHLWAVPIAGGKETQTYYPFDFHPKTYGKTQ